MNLLHAKALIATSSSNWNRWILVTGIAHAQTAWGFVGRMKWKSGALEVQQLPRVNLFSVSDSCNFSRCKVDISALPLKQANCLELPLESCLGTLLMLVTLTPCAGVSVSDLCVCPLADPSERKQMAQRFVSVLPCHTPSRPPHPPPLLSWNKVYELKNCLQRDLCPKFNGMSPKTRHQP